MKHILRNGIRTLCALGVVAGFVLGQAPLAHAANGACQSVDVPVALVQGQPKNITISGRLCMPSAPNSNKKIDLFVHGGTYNRAYWDYPVNNPQYSYVDRTLQQGRAAFYYDRLAAGNSSRPLSTSATVQADAFVLHQLISWLRADRGFQDISLIGHSVGSIVAHAETAAYNDADRVAFTGITHGLNNLSALLTAGKAFYPALLDSQFSASLPDPGYLTTLPGTRQNLFYAGAFDPAVVAYDEAHKDIMSTTIFTDALVQFDTPAPLNPAQRITIPVFVQLGMLDTLFCTGITHANCSSAATLHANEAPYFTNAASLTASAIPNTGHNLTLHTTAEQSFAELNQWVQSH